MKQAFYFLVGILFILGSLYLFLNQPVPERYTPKTVEDTGYTDITVGNVPIKVEIARSVSERKMGLSGREGLAYSQGMLFDFAQMDFHGIWMKDMKFNIDIIWINEEGVVVSIEKDVSPQTFPTVFYPTEAARYVLEVPSGFTDENQIEIGSQVNLKT
jgi:uncharacterized protein